MRDLLRVERADTDGVAVFSLSGELDLASAPLLKEHLDSVDGRGPRVVLDLSRCAFIDSTGLTVLVEAASRDGCSIALVGPNAQVRRVFEITAVETLVPLFETMAEAHAAFPLREAGVGSETPTPGGDVGSPPESP